MELVGRRKGRRGWYRCPRGGHDPFSFSLFLLVFSSVISHLVLGLFLPLLKLQGGVPRVFHMYAEFVQLFLTLPASFCFSLSAFNALARALYGLSYRFRFE